ncbi:MAG: hypothetical protein GY778_07100, partial [bacterium]|nr:hypothetical protein [bacterium]
MQSFDPKGRDEKVALADLGAIPVWDVVVDRGDYMARRNKRGILYGRLGESTGPYRWFVDETEGSGALGIRLEAKGIGTLARATRLVAWGAWQVDDKLQWVWKAERVLKLAPREVALPPGVESVPGHQIVEISERPRGARRLAGVAESTEERDVVFEVTRIPKDPTDGWPVSNRTKWKSVARLHLPGERATYGA